MGAKIPEIIRKDVIKQWLAGLSRDQIARENKIGTGTVSMILNERKQDRKKYSNDETEFGLLRELAVILKKEGISVNLFAASIRLQRVLEQKGLKEEQIESFLENIETHCFRLGKKEEEFIESIDKISVYSKSCGIPLDRLLVHIMQLQRQLTQLKRETENIRKRKDRALIDHNLTTEKLEEYEQSKPLLYQLYNLKKRVEKMTRINAELDYNLAKEQWDRFMEKYEWSVPESELTVISAQYIPFRSMDKRSQAEAIFDIAKSFLNHPAEYLDVIVSIKERQFLSERSLKKGKNMHAIDNKNPALIL